ncbi:AtpZ/AtpI family protein [Acetobacteraceae bacterium H6797]|nr:AtpZ/AtpI family protein [Acetobacteraceae bacterium H6797]
MSEQNDFERRLKAARTKQGMDRNKRDHLDLPRGTMGIGFRVGVELVSALMVGCAIGYALDYWLGSFPWLFIVFFVLGGAAGILNVLRLFSGPRDAEKRN